MYLLAKCLFSSVHISRSYTSSCGLVGAPTTIPVSLPELTVGILPIIWAEPRPTMSPVPTDNLN